MAEPASRKRSFGVVVGWMLTAPGFVMLAAILLFLAGAHELAGCRFNILASSPGCAPGLFGTLMHIVMLTGLWSALAIMYGVGIVPVSWSLIYPPVRWWLHRRARRASAHSPR